MLSCWVVNQPERTSGDGSRLSGGTWEPRREAANMTQPRRESQNARMRVVFGELSNAVPVYPGVGGLSTYVE
jgi:hypothetical protein